MTQEIIHRINQLGKEGNPFLFIINYKGDLAFIKRLSDIHPEECLYDFEGVSNLKETYIPLSAPITWQIENPRYQDYKRSFDIVKSNIMAGNSYLVNLTCKVAVTCNLTLRDVFLHTNGKYKLWLKKPNQLSSSEDTPTPQCESFVCFSPESFIKIKNGRIYSYPMKGTLDATIPHAEELLMSDKKEAAEHATIVDLIRNDLSRVAEDVRVDQYRYMDLLHTNKGDILQTSSEISGRLPEHYANTLGDILTEQLPAGSITGAPKDKTMQIIHEAEGYERGFYTGIMGIYQNGELNSAVMIRYIEQEDNQLYFKAGGGITSKSEFLKEYEEVLQKIYLPISLLSKEIFP